MKQLNFHKEFKNYDANATIQKKVADKLLSFIDTKNSYSTILELGCGTGIFTRSFLNSLNFNSLDLNDLFDTKEYFQDISYNNFFQGDMCEIPLKKYSLILSSSAFQWVDCLESLIKKLVLSTDNLIFSIYTQGNLIEIFQHFGISLKYLSAQEIQNILKKYFSQVTFSQEEFQLDFSTPFEALKHLKKTGVTGFQSSSYSLTKSFKSTKLTYRVSYFSCKNN